MIAVDVSQPAPDVVGRKSCVGDDADFPSHSQDGWDLEGRALRKLRNGGVARALRYGERDARSHGAVEDVVSIPERSSEARAAVRRLAYAHFLVPAGGGSGIPGRLRCSGIRSSDAYRCTSSRASWPLRTSRGRGGLTAGPCSRGTGRWTTSIATLGRSTRISAVHGASWRSSTVRREPF